MPQKTGMDRRQFMKYSAGAAVVGMGFPSIVPTSVLGRTGIVLPSDRITVGCIGMGGMGLVDMRSFLFESDARVVAVCDVDAHHLQRAKKIVDERYGNNDCATYGDFRELVARDDIDVVTVTTPDHWHAIPAITAAKAGKDIYCEKPLAHSLLEGRAICDAVKRYGCIMQTGSWQRSQANYRFACELVLNGRIGKVHTVEVGLPGEYEIRGNESQTVTKPPKELDYDFWLGPAPYSDYISARVHYHWRWIREYGGGQLMNTVNHDVDIAHLGLGLDYTGPVEVEGTGKKPESSLYNCFNHYRIKTKYANGVEMIILGAGMPDSAGSADILEGVKWIGEDGWVFVARGKIDTNPTSLLRERFSPDEIHLHQASSLGDSVEQGHVRNFLDCVTSRAETLAPSEIAQRSSTVGHLGQISMLLGRKIRFNPETEEIIADTAAARMLGGAMRSPWHL